MCKLREKVEPELISGNWETKANNDSGEISEDNYQLGWHSMMWFKKGSDNHFYPLDCKNLLQDEHVSEVSVDPAKPYSQVVTRGVQSCTAVILSRGDLYGFMHLDTSTIEQHASFILQQVEQRLSGEQGPIRIRASRLDEDLEKDFIGKIEKTCFNAYGANAPQRQKTSFSQLEEGDGEVDMQVLDRKEFTMSHMMGHFEIGIACSSSSPQPKIFGDIREMKISDGKVQTSSKDFSCPQDEFEKCTKAVLSDKTPSAPAVQKSADRGGACLIL